MSVNHPEQAAAGLWSTTENLANLAVELTKGYHGKSDVISKRSARQMLAPVKPGEDLSAYFGGQPAMTFVTDGEGERSTPVCTPGFWLGSQLCRNRWTAKCVFIQSSHVKKVKQGVL